LAGEDGGPPPGDEGVAGAICPAERRAFQGIAHDRWHPSGTFRSEPGRASARTVCPRERSTGGAPGPGSLPPVTKTERRPYPLYGAGAGADEYPYPDGAARAYLEVRSSSEIPKP